MPVPSEQVDAAKARLGAASTGSAEQILLSLPTNWQPLYDRPDRSCYDKDHFDFEGVVREILECPEHLPLSQIHKATRSDDFEPCPQLKLAMTLAGMLLPEQAVKSKTNRERREWKANVSHQRLLDLYTRFVREELLPSLGAAAGEARLFEAVVQAQPVLRVVMPSSNAATKMHMDAEYGHIPEELNFWMPLSPVWGSNSLLAESFPGRGDFTAFEGKSGHVFRWWGNQCRHYADSNSTDSTRVSLDFRLVPGTFWAAAVAAGTPEEAERARVYHHGGNMCVGSYYSLEQGLVKGSCSPQPETGPVQEQAPRVQLSDDDGCCWAWLRSVHDVWLSRTDPESSRVRSKSASSFDVRP
ncbi:unnamed protein product [Polarella glacialis]|nr:unnamed protein product [Polarella glacialis]